MLVFGAKGLGKEVLDICIQDERFADVSFYDDISTDLPAMLYDKYHILRHIDEAANYFRSVDNRFVIGIGGPKLRELAYNKFSEIGGVPQTIISDRSYVGTFAQLEAGVNVMVNSVITNDARIGKGCLINQMASISHDVVLGDFVEVCPAVAIAGNCKIGNYVFLGTNCTILPNVKIGNNVIVGAGTVVISDVPDNCTVVGVPGRIIKQT